MNIMNENKKVDLRSMEEQQMVDLAVEYGEQRLRLLTGGLPDGLHVLCFDADRPGEEPDGW